MPNSCTFAHQTHSQISNLFRNMSLFSFHICRMQMKKSWLDRLLCGFSPQMAVTGDSKTSLDSGVCLSEERMQGADTVLTTRPSCPPLPRDWWGRSEIAQKPWETRALAREPRCVVLDSMEGSTCDCFLNFFFFLVSHSCRTTFRSGFFLRFYLGSGFWVLTRPVPSGLALVFCMLATLRLKWLMGDMESIIVTLLVTVFWGLSDLLNVMCLALC